MNHRDAKYAVCVVYQTHLTVEMYCIASFLCIINIDYIMVFYCLSLLPSSGGPT